MKIYKHEQALASLLKNNKVSVASSISKTDKVSVELTQALHRANPDQIDLDYRYGILTSIGWNGNDDVFAKAYTWASRKSPVDKQLNYMHDNTFIVGHMTDSFGLNREGKLILDDIKEEEIPDEYDLGVAFVIYARPEQFTPRDKAIAKIVQEINDGTLYLSMEVIFDDFDYAVMDSEGKQQTVARNDETSFLTKHLRAYGGSGEYDGYKVGRLLKNMTFSGIGIVDEPANSRSIIFNKDDIKSFISSGNLILKDKKMNEEDIKKLQGELAAAQEKAKKVDELSTTLATLQGEVDTLKSQVKTLETEKTTLSEQLSSANKKVEEAEAKINLAAAEQAKAQRVEKLVSAGQTKEEAEKIVSSWASLDDAKFDEIVSLYTKSTKTEQKVEADITKASVINPVIPNQSTDEAAAAASRQEKLTAWFSSALKLPVQDKGK